MEDEKLQSLLDKRDELMLVRDILSLQLEILELKEALKTNGNTHTEESEGRQ